MLNIIKISTENIVIMLLIALWVITQFIASEHFDMRTSVDSILYISGAEKMLNGQFPEGREILYSSYMLLLAILSLMNLAAGSIVYIHYIAAIAAMICAYHLAIGLTGDKIIAILAPLLYVLWFKFQQWNLIIYTDAIFSHMVVISIYALVKSKGAKEKGAAVLLIFFTSMLRPTGLGLFLGTAVYFMSQFMAMRSYGRYQKVFGLTILIIVFSSVLNFALTNFIDSFIESYKMAEIIYPKVNLWIQSPADLYIPDINQFPLVRLFLFILNNFFYVIQISAIKGLLFIGHIKPYYSLVHNGVIAVFLYPAYFLAIIGYRSMKTNGLKLMIAWFLAFQLITVSLTSENWDGRFLLPILPLIFILSSLGLSNFLSKNSLTKKPGW